ncbi:toll/interleukin-1 receptor domain-containing protein [Methylophilus luteus]|uniref:Toll/interleukin-1 receptor domain-containing protein n=1 Tax=Methylophilus luteus TaxID=640108 RepID=A0ABW3F928_9PROT
MTFLYQLAVLGAPSQIQISKLSESLAQALAPLNLGLGHEVALEVLPATFKPHQLQPAAAVFFADVQADTDKLEELLQRGVPVLPVVSSLDHATIELPEILQPLNCLSDADTDVIAASLLESVGLLPRQRRVFISYRRDEAATAATQLFNALVERQFDVFLDSQGTAPAAEEEALSWHNLYDADVLLMLDTPNYFENRWTNAEFGRVLAKGISVLKVSWPDAAASMRSSTASVLKLAATDFSPDAAHMAEQTLLRICQQLEEVRSQNHAVRAVNLVSSIRLAIQAIGGKMLGVSTHKAVHLQLPGGEHVTVYPTAGVPVPFNLQQAVMHTPGQPVAVVYDPIGLHQAGLTHLDWLKTHTQAASWIKATEADVQFSKWGH